jgi:hypothetical protein
MGLKLTEKREEELYNNAVGRVRGMLPPQSIAEKMYPKLKTSADPSNPNVGQSTDGAISIRRNETS